MTRDEAVRALQRGFYNAGMNEDRIPTPTECLFAVAALVAAGWGDLTAERERLAAAVEAERATRTDVHVRAALMDAARLIRTTTEEAQP
jgi:hypothetical protein